MLHRVLWVLLSYCVSCIHTLCRVNIVSVLEHCNALWFLCWCIVVWSWVNMGGLGFCSRALHRAGFAAFWPLVGVILNQPWYCIAWWSLPKPTQNTTSFPPLCLLSWLFGNLSISPTPVLGPRGSQFVVADLCWSWNLKVGVFWNNYHSTISLTVFQGNFWTNISLKPTLFPPFHKISTDWMLWNIPHGTDMIFVTSSTSGASVKYFWIWS